MSIPTRATDVATIAAWMKPTEGHYPITEWIGPPRYTWETITERIEPWATQYDHAQWELPDVDPDPLFYRPTPLLIELEERLDALRDKGFRAVPNPDYDPVRAAAYWDAQHERFNQTTITVGQSYSTPD